MNDQNDINKKIDKALDSLDGIRRAEPLPFFYTRLIGRLQREEKGVWAATGSFLARPLVVVVGLCLILIFNAFLLLNGEPSKDLPVANNQQTEQLVTDNESMFASNSSFDYENLDQQ